MTKIKCKRMDSVCRLQVIHSRHTTISVGSVLASAEKRSYKIN